MRYMKNVLVILLSLAAGFAAGYFIKTSNVAVPQQPTDEKDPGMVCIQVITSARNPETGEIREFPTPCDVPDEWEIIQNEVPGLEPESN